MNIAAINKLPIIFVCENNLYSTHMSIKEVRNSSEIYKMAEPLKIKSARVDGNDVLEIAEISKNMIEYCREGNGPVFLEFMTYRMRGHVGPDDNIQGKRTDIRNSEEVENWKAKDPINKLIKTLKANDFITEQEVSNIHKSILSKIEQAHKNAKEACFPPGNIEEVKKYVYS
jgi:pyruvate dehydrogenase E1 component alpha subunit